MKPPHAAAGPGSWDGAYEWKAVLLLGLGFGLVGLDRWIIAPLAPAIMNDLGLAPQDINNLVAALGVAWGLSAILMGNLSDRFGRRPVLLPAIILFSLASGLSGLAGSFMTLILIRSLMGVTEGAFCPTSFAATAEASKPSRLGFNQGFQQSMFALLGLGFGPIVATQLLAIMPWRAVFLVMTVPGLIIAALLWAVLRDPVRQARQPYSPAAPTAPFADIFKHRNIGLGIIGLLCAMCGIFVLGANVPIYLVDHLHLDSKSMGLVTSAIGFGGFVGQWALPAASDRFGRKIMAILGFTGGAFFLTLFMRCGAEPFPLFLTLFASTASSFGLLALITGPIATEAAPPGMISTVAGLIIGIGEIGGGGLALLVAGYVVARYGIDHMLYLALGGLLCGVIVSLFFRETAPRKISLLAAEA